MSPAFLSVSFSPSNRLFFVYLIILWSGQANYSDFNFEAGRTERWFVESQKLRAHRCQKGDSPTCLSHLTLKTTGLWNAYEMVSSFFGSGPSLVTQSSFYSTAVT